MRELSEDKKDVNGNIIREGTQVFYSNHSPNCLSAGTFNESFIVRKTKEKGTFLRYTKVGDFVKDLEKRNNIDSSEEDLFLH